MNMQTIRERIVELADQQPTGCLRDDLLGVDEMLGALESPLPPEGERAFIVTCKFGWGKDTTLMGAKGKCLAQSPRGSQIGQQLRVRELILRAQLVHKDTVCESDGSISYPKQYPPIDLGEV